MSFYTLPFSGRSPAPSSSTTGRPTEEPTATLPLSPPSRCRSSDNPRWESSANRERFFHEISFFFFFVPLALFLFSRTSATRGAKRGQVSSGEGNEGRRVVPSETRGCRRWTRLSISRERREHPMMPYIHPSTRFAFRVTPNGLEAGKKKPSGLNDAGRTSRAFAHAVFVRVVWARSLR